MQNMKLLMKTCMMKIWNNDYGMSFLRDKVDKTQVKPINISIN